MAWQTKLIAGEGETIPMKKFINLMSGMTRMLAMMTLLTAAAQAQTSRAASASSYWSSSEGRRMLQLGILLLLFGLLVGFAVPVFAAPRLGLTAHVLGVTQGILLIVIGLLWPKLRLTRTASGIGFWMVVYGCFISWAVTVLA